MNILLTNDDGVHAAGILSLFRILGDRHDVYLMAPHQERSACSSAITVREGVKIETMGERMFAVHGYPADCVNIGLHGNLLPPIELVISGINHGPNLGDDIYFSGTFAAARAALIFGISGIAVSLDCMRSSDYFDDVSRFLLGFIDDRLETNAAAPVCFNINYPDLPRAEILGVRFTFLGRRDYRDSYRLAAQSGGSMSLQLNGVVESVDREGSDVTELRNGYISVTPIRLDATDYSYLDSVPRIEGLWQK